MLNRDDNEGHVGIVLDGSTNENSAILEELENEIHNPDQSTGMYLKDVNLDDEELSRFLKAITVKRSVSWEAISIDNCQGSTSKFMTLLTEESARFKLERLTLDSIVIDVDLSRVLGKAIESMTLMINVVEFQNMSFSADCVNLILSAIASSPALETLSFASCRFMTTAPDDLAKGLVDCTSIKNFNFTSCGLSQPQLASVMDSLSHLPQLKRIDFGRTIFSSHEAVRSLENFLATTPSLEHIDLTLPHNVDVPSLGVTRKRRRISKQRTVQVLYSRRNPHNDNGVELFSCSVCCKLATGKKRK